MKMIHSYTLSCSPNLVGGTLMRQRTHYATKGPCAIKSSILLQKDEDGKLTASSDSFPPSTGNAAAASLSVLGHSNAVGIIGGVSAASTLSFLQKLVDWSSREGRESLPFIVCNDPTLNRELSSCERNLGKSCFLPEYDVVLENLLQKRKFLERSGARCIITPFHISNLWYEKISEGCTVPLFHVGECMASELKEADLKPIEAGSNCKIGILATEATLKAEIYQEKLQNQGFEVVLPDKATMEHTVLPAMEALNRKDTEGARTLLRIALQFLLLRAVSTVILASEDLQKVLPHGDPLLKKCVYPMDALARATIKWAYSREHS
ncbi:uncharacterized protein LOC116245715 isoform X1 [Nymphaea colorata]|nr:uncharacterized protein LOC116245715 isoform X1 [Nymphaea colorata]